jgi:hypothetical protein
VQHVHRIDRLQSFDPGHRDQNRLLWQNLEIAIFVLGLLPVRYECSFVASKFQDLQNG